MRTLQILSVLILSGTIRIAFAQEMPAEVRTMLKADDSAKVAAFVTKGNLNDCYTESERQYSLLAQTIRYHATKCFNLLIARGADVNKSCNGYVPPLFHAAKYGSLEMVKILVAKGADINFKYDGEYTPAVGETPLTYAEKNNQPEIANYLRSLNSKQ